MDPTQIVLVVKLAESLLNDASRGNKAVEKNSTTAHLIGGAFLLW